MNPRVSCLLGLLPCAAVWAQPPVVIQSETKIVLVDAVVTGKKGQYIHDLSAKDFHVWEDNKEQTIQSFTLEAARGEAAAPRTNYTVLVFDYGDMDAGAQIRARQSAAQFIDANTGPDRLMAVAIFDGGFRIAQGFTGNAGRLKDVILGAKSSVAAIDNRDAGTSATTDLSSRDKFRALQRLALDLSSAPGRKTMILLTGSLTLSNVQALKAAIDACNKSNVAVYPIDVRDSSVASTFSAENGPGGGGRGGGRGGIGGGGGRGGRGGGPANDADPGEALDPGGASQQALFALASGTGGFVIRNAAELPDGLQKIGQEQEEYYVLGYTPPASKDGVCHALRVKVDRGGTTVRARASYCTGKAQDLLASSPVEKNLENRAYAEQTGNISASMRLPFFYVGPGVARINLAMEIAPDAVKFDRKNGTFHAEINVLGIASAAQGDSDTGARFSDTFTLDFSDAELQKWRQKTLHYEKEFKIASGQYKFTVVFSSGGQSFGKLEQPLIVEPYHPGEWALSSIALGKETRKTADTALVLFEDKTPLTAGDAQLIPAGSNVFTKSDPFFCYFEVYAPDPAKPGDIGVRIVDKTGGSTWDGGSIHLDAMAGGKSTIPVGLTLPIASLAPGAYQLEIAGADANKSMRRSVDFEVQ